ncbi:hypothetical protein SUDANB6_01053 [Streptomyces sp. enrichment culture]
MSQRVLTAESGAPVADNQNSAAAAVGGPLPLRGQHLLEKPARFSREPVPERVVHARGSGACGRFEVTDDVTGCAHAGFLDTIGKRTGVFVRSPTAAGSLGGGAVREPRGCAVGFHTREGNCDPAGDNTPVLFVKAPVTSPDLVHSQKRDPFTGRREPDGAWDFRARSPEAVHRVTWLMGDRGIPASYRHTNGYGSRTYQRANGKGEVFLRAGESYRPMPEQGKRRPAAGIAGGPSQVSHDDATGKNPARFRAVGTGYGERVEEAVRALRED